MTITATAEPLEAPPRVAVDVAVPAGRVMTEVAVWRNDSSGRSLVRTQPAAGFESRQVLDYECPYEVGVTYDWAATYYNPADNLPTFSEPFTSWPGSWTGNTANASVASNRVTLVGLVDVYRSILRSGLNAGWDVIRVAYLNIPTFGNVLYGLRFQIGATELVLGTIGSTLYVQRSTGITVDALPTGIDATQPFTVTRSGSTLTITGTGGSFAVSSSLSIGNVTAIRIESGPVDESGVNAIVGAITVQTFATTTSIAEESSAVTLSPPSAWIIAPQSPTLSVEITPEFTTALPQVVDLAPIVNADAKTYHRVLGASRPVTSSSGPQGSDELALTLLVHTRAQELALRALAEPQVPVLVRFPPSLGYGFTDDYYAIGDLTRERLVQVPDDEGRWITLPLVAVEAPDVDVENVAWSWAAVVTTYPTWSAVLGAYATWADLAADNRTGA